MPTLMLLLTLLAQPQATFGPWKQLPSLPDQEGFAGSFAGVSHDALLVAGGANFPGQKPWAGGKKVWYDDVFVLGQPAGQWKVAGRLPRPLGYGVSVTYRDAVLCVGGSDAERHYADAFRLEWKAGKLSTTPLPSLPCPIANACGAIVDEMLYVAGGQEKPDAHSTLKTVYRLDLSVAEPQWKHVESWPGGSRMLAVAAAYEGAFWIVGGVDLAADDQGQVSRRYLRDAYRYHPIHGWTRIADLPYPMAAAPSPAPAAATGFYLLGGDDGSQLALRPEHHRGFSKQILRFDANTEKWTEAGKFDAARVTAPCVSWHNSWVVASGEVCPGIRSPEVWRAALQNRD